MTTKIAQKIHLTPAEKKQLDLLSKKAGMSLSDFVGQLIMEAAGKKSKEPSLGKIEAAIDYLVSLGDTIEKAHVNSAFNRVVLTQILYADAPDVAKQRVGQAWGEQKVKLGIE